MRAPFFWYRSPGILSILLKPLSWLYAKGGRFLRALKTSESFSIPIISVGNIVAGGAGKTPIAIELSRLFQEKGIKVHFVSRGYGGTEQGPLKVNPLSHSPSGVGDEPLLLAQHAPTWVSKKRILGVREAIKSGAQLIILDDGHQTIGINKDISFVVVDLFQKFGNGCVIPAGPLREDLKEGLSRADALILIGDGKFISLIPSFKASIMPKSLAIPSGPIVAFCAIGFPEKFYKTLEDLGVNLVATETFKDHHYYQEKDFLRLQKLAKEHQARLVTTRKDLIKIPPTWQENLHVLDINIHFENSEEIYRFILEKIPSLKRSFEN